MAPKRFILHAIPERSWPEARGRRAPAITRWSRLTHLGWIAGLFFLIPPDAQPFWPVIGLYVVLQAARYWVIATLGPYWTHRIITLDEAPIVSSGAYRFFKHPNYAITIAETLLLPLAFSAVALALIMTAIWVAVLSYKIRLEDAALAKRHGPIPP